MVGYAPRPYPSAGASYELELYLAVGTCDGLAPGFYHYDAGAHALVPIGVPSEALKALLAGAAYVMGVPAPPQILITSPRASAACHGNTARSPTRLSLRTSAC